MGYYPSHREPNVKKLEDEWKLGLWEKDTRTRNSASAAREIVYAKEYEVHPRGVEKLEGIHSACSILCGGCLHHSLRLRLGGQSSPGVGFRVLEFRA